MVEMESKLGAIAEQFEDLRSVHSEAAWLFVACSKQSSESDAIYYSCASDQKLQQLVQKRGRPGKPRINNAVRDACLAAFSEPTKGKPKLQRLVPEPSRRPSRAAADALPIVRALLDITLWIPLIVSTSLQASSDIGVRVGLSITFGLTIAQLFVNYILYKAGVAKVWPRLFEVCQSIIFGTLLVTSFVDRRSRIPLRWFYFFSTAALAAACLLSTAILHPMSIDYTRERVPAWSWQLRSIKRGSLVVTFCWAAALATMAVSTMITLVIRRPDFALVAVFNYLIPYALLAAVAVFSGSYMAPTVATIRARDRETKEDAKEEMAAEYQASMGPLFDSWDEVGVVLLWPMAAIVLAFANMVAACTSGFSLWTILPYLILLAIGLWSQYTTEQILEKALEYMIQAKVLVTDLMAASHDAPAEISAGDARETQETTETAKELGKETGLPKELGKETSLPKELGKETSMETTETATQADMKTTTKETGKETSMETTEAPTEVDTETTAKEMGKETSKETTETAPEAYSETTATHLEDSHGLAATESDSKHESVAEGTAPSSASDAISHTVGDSGTSTRVVDSNDETRDLAGGSVHL